MAELRGHDLSARTLRRLGVTHAYGVSGFPITETLAACVNAGIRPIGVRHEQAAVLASIAQNYVSGKLSAVSILPSGPGVTNAATGIFVASENQWPVVVLGGRATLSPGGIGAFQELDAASVFRPITKWSAVVETTADIPESLTRAFDISMQGAPGPVYLDLPREVSEGTSPEPVSRKEDSETEASAPTSPAEGMRRAADLLLGAKRPMMILGEGVRWSQPLRELGELVELLQLPFITSPMGRGYLPDDHPLCFSSARTRIQESADVVLMIGAKLNWIFRIGMDLKDDARVIQLTPDECEGSENPDGVVRISGDLRKSLTRLIATLMDANGNSSLPDSRTPWLDELAEMRRENREALEPYLQSNAVPMTPHRLMKEVRDFVPRDAIVVVDGNICMGAARQVIPSYLPASRLNCGLAGCVGVGIPFAIGAKQAEPERMVVCIIGDSALGFCAMEMETAIRNRIPVIIVVANNDGIGGHRTQAAYYPSDYPERVTTFLPNLHYEKFMEVFGGHSEYVEKPEDLAQTLERAAASETAVCINVRLDPDAPYPGGGPRPAWDIAL